MPPFTPEPTTRQQEFLDQIADFTARHGYGPSVRELMATLGIRSPNGVICSLKALRRKGFVTWEPLRSRTLRVLGGDPEGWVAATRLPNRDGTYIILYKPTFGDLDAQAMIARFETAKGWRGLPPGQRRSGILFWSCMPKTETNGKD